MYVCMYVCMYACNYVCMYVCVYVCMYACNYVCMYECMYVCLRVFLFCVYVVCLCVCKGVVEAGSLWQCGQCVQLARTMFHQFGADLFTMQQTSVKLSFIDFSSLKYIYSFRFDGAAFRHFKPFNSS